MTETPAATRAKANRRLERFEDAHEAYLFRGAGYPEDKEAVEERYLAERNRFIDMLMRETPL